ncbi:MAG: NifB/NifX family molybdenum-iron cluster-binding protein [Ignavibacteriaceae bacterium]|jgi:predicted Fe-Mo cluster-binding NifX family protein
MLIAITSERMDLNSFVAEKFGRTPFIIFYDTEKNTFEFLRNPYANIFGGAGIQTAQFMIEKNAVAVITTEIGIHPLRLLESANVLIYSCTKKQVKEIVNQFVAGNLSIIKHESFQKGSRGGIGRKRRNRNKNF